MGGHVSRAALGSDDLMAPQTITVPLLQLSSPSNPAPEAGKDEGALAATIAPKHRREEPTSGCDHERADAQKAQEDSTTRIVVAVLIASGAITVVTLTGGAAASAAIVLLAL